MFKTKSKTIFLGLLCLFLWFCIPKTNVQAASTSPIADTTVNPLGYNNVPDTITFNITDPGSGGFNYIILPDGSISYQQNNSYKVSTNGTYRFTMVDNNNAQYYWDVNVNNIDTEPPTISFNNITDGGTYTTITPNITVKDTGVSGLQAYTLTLNNAAYTEGTPISKSGNYTLQVVAEDNAGNASTKSINFSINEPPTLSVNLSNKTVTRTQKTQLNILTADVEDSDSVNVTVNAGASAGDNAYNTGLDSTSYTLKGTKTVNFDASLVPVDKFVFNSTTNEYEQNVYFTTTATDSFGSAVSDSQTLLVVNHIPTTTNIPDLSLNLQQTSTVNLNQYFSDADSDNLTYSVQVGDSSVASVLQSQGVLAIQGLSVGQTKVTITANDGNLGTIQNSFNVTVANRPPVLSGNIPDVSGNLNKTTTVDLSAYFHDDDAGDSLTYTISSDNDKVATATINKNVATLTFTGAGTANLTVTAMDSHGASVKGSFKATVQNTPPILTVNVNTNPKTFKKGDTIAVTGTIKDLENQKITVQATIGGVERSVDIPNGNGEWGVYWSASDIPNGTYTKIDFTILDNGLTITQSENINYTINVTDNNTTTPVTNTPTSSPTTSVPTQTNDGSNQNTNNQTTSPINNTGTDQSSSSQGTTDTQVSNGNYDNSNSDSLIPTDTSSSNGENNGITDSSGNKTKPVTLEEKIKMILVKNSDVKQPWLDIYVENILDTFTTDELSNLQGNTSKIYLIVNITNKIETFRHTQSTKSLFDMHQYIIEHKEIVPYLNLVNTTSDIETSALKEIVPYDSDSLSLYQPNENEIDGNFLSSNLPTTVDTGIKINGIFNVTDTNILMNNPKLSIYAQKEDNNDYGYVGNVFKWVRLTEASLSPKNEKVEAAITFKEPGTYSIKMQLMDGGKAYTKTVKLVVSSNEKNNSSGNSNSTKSTNNVTKSTHTSITNSTNDSSNGISKTQIILIAIGALSLMGLGGFSIYRKFF